MNKPVLKSWSISISVTRAIAATTWSFENIFATPGNGLTTISPIGRNIKIRRVDAFTDLNPRGTGTANNGFTAQFWQMEFNFVDFAGQIIRDGSGFQNLFVPEVGLSVSNADNYFVAINEKNPFIDCELEGGGIYISKIKQSSAGMVNPSNPIFTITITIWYEDLECN